MSKKYYIVFSPKKAIFYMCDSWEKCKKKTKEIKTDFFLKSFKKKEVAICFLKEKKKEFKNKKLKTDLSVFVDGSFDEKNNKYSYGFVIVDNKTKENIYEEKGIGKNIEAAKMRNVAGEIKGVMQAMSFCKNNNIKEITICYDYIGIEAWINGTWKCKNSFTKAYFLYMQQSFLSVKFFFRKIKSHSNDKWNDKADELAKKALTKQKI